MASKITPISQILPGKIDWSLKVRVILLWSIPEYKNQHQTNSIEMIWIDEESAKIHATVKKALIGKFSPILDEGSTFFVKNVLVAQNDAKFQSTKHKYKLAFIGNTICVKTEADHIPRNHFDFVAFREILEATKEDKLIDVIGHIVEKGDIKETEKNGTKSKLIDIVLQDLQSETVHCALWEDYAEKMQRFLDNHDSVGPLILILQLGKLKKFSGLMGVSNAFFGTKLLLNADIPEVTQYIQGMNVTGSQLTQVVSQMTGQTTLTLQEELMQTPIMSIADLYEAREKCFGAVLATIIDIDNEYGWYYDACPRCMKRVHPSGNKHLCDKCKKPCAPVPSFKVQLQVRDHTGSATFVLFDRVVSAHLGKPAKDFIDPNSKHASDLPIELKAFVNKQWLFKVEVTDGHIYQHWQSYAVRKMTDDSVIVHDFIENHHLQAHQRIGDVEADADNAVSNEKQPFIVECGASNNNLDEGELHVDETPTSKATGKRVAAIEAEYPVIHLGDTQASATKSTKITPDIHPVATKGRKMSRVKAKKMTELLLVYASS